MDPTRRRRKTLPAGTFRGLVESRDLLHAQWDEPLPVPELARAAGLSPSHFIRAFESAFGATPHRYQVRLRLDKAKELLRRGVSVTDACFDTGFSSLGSWSTLFSREFGTSPGTYRRELARLYQVPTPYQRLYVPICFLRHFAPIAVSEKSAIAAL